MEAVDMQDPLISSLKLVAHLLCMVPKYEFILISDMAMITGLTKCFKYQCNPRHVIKVLLAIPWVVYVNFFQIRLALGSRIMCTTWHLTTDITEAKCSKHLFTYI